MRSRRRAGIVTVAVALAAASCGYRASGGGGHPGGDGGQSDDVDAGSQDAQAGQEDAGAGEALCRRTGHWEIEPILERGGRSLVGLMVSRDGSVHALLLGTDQTLEHLTNSGGVWSTEIVGEAALGASYSVAEAPDGRVHIVFVEAESLALVHAHSGDAGLESETISGTQVALNPVAAVGPDGAVHICYLELSGNARSFVHLDDGGGDWSSEVVASGENLAGYSIAIDAGGVVHIVYYQVPAGSSKYTLWHADNASDGWQATAVDEDVDVPSAPGLAIGPGGEEHLCYHGGRQVETGDALELRYATNRSGEWRTRIIDERAEWHYVCSIGVDARGAVHMGYDFAAANGAEPSGYGYATNESGAWDLQTIADDEAMGLCFLGLDAEGNAHAVTGSLTAFRHAWRVAGECE